MKRVKVTSLGPFEYKTLNKTAQEDDVDLKQQNNLSRGKHRVIINLLGAIYLLQDLLLELAGHNVITWFYRM